MATLYVKKGLSKIYIFFQIAYAENLCKELEKQVEELQKKLEDENDQLKNSRNKQVMAIELKEVQKLLKKHTEQLEHLKTHESKPLKLIMALILVIFVVWMIFVLTSNWGKFDDEIEIY